MKVASGLASSPEVTAELAAIAVRQALEKAELEQAANVLLFLTRDFQRHAQAAVLAAARTAGCLQVAGCTASGVFTEAGWRTDQPAAAALVLGPRAVKSTGDLRISFSGHSRLPYDWQDDRARAGLLDSEATTWSHGRIDQSALSDLLLDGLHAHPIVCPGLRPLGDAQTVESSAGYDLQCLGGHTAADSLLRALPPEMRERPPLHALALSRGEGLPAISLLSINGDGSLTLADEIEAGEKLTWCMRQALYAESEMRSALTAAVHGQKKPKFGLMFSCIGRGPLFYGNEDRDLQAYVECFPGLPLIGAYGTGQIVPAAKVNHLFHNTALTVLFESPDV
ncbi:FIST C-terminal domain-containing protein [Azonexus sp. IMCC34839]|uniref:FIST C-terminal domain-containing protein n=1 Tax=Azonexus sp. IMCC34839 TaxID=3133695 RepID=UPI00399ACAE0